MDNIILIFICLFAGLGLQHVRAVPTNAHTALNQFVIYIALPAMSLYYIPKIAISSQLLYPLALAWIMFALSWIFFAGLGKIFGWSKKLTGCLIITGGLSNTSFVGFPIIQALYGQEGLKIAIITDQPGSFVIVSSVAVLVAVLYSKGSTSPSVIARKILLFPPFIAFIVAISLKLFNYDFMETAQSIFLKLGATVTPVALVAVGLQIKIERTSRHWRFLWLGLLFKLLIVPVFFFMLYKVIFKAEGQDIQVCLMQAAMPPMITAAIVASSNGLKPRLSGMMIGVGIPLSFITMTVWYFLISSF